MSRKTLLRMMTRDGKTRPAAAADELDRAVEKILRTLKQGKPVRLPGVGDLVPERERLRFITGEDGKEGGE
jgi:nucleoid DNA-binding protein